MKYLMLLFLVSCSGVNQVLDKNTFYKNDIKFCDKQTEKCYDGIGVLPKRSQYEFDIYLKGKADLFTLTTNNREVTHESAWVDGWWPDKKRVKIKYRPNRLEDVNPVFLGGYEKINGRNSWGIIAFKDPDFKKIAWVNCNGSAQNIDSVSFCQSKHGLIQQIAFNEPMEYSKSEGCPDFKIDNESMFTYEIGLGECVYTFKTKRNPSEFHRHYTYGYEGILIRED